MSAWGLEQERGNAIRLRRIVLPSLPHSAFRLRTLKCLAPHTAVRVSAISKTKAKPQVVSKGKDNMAGFDSVYVRFWFSLKSKAARVIRSSDNLTPDSFRENERKAARDNKLRKVERSRWPEHCRSSFCRMSF
jgi:hypothetical protein